MKKFNIALPFIVLLAASSTQAQEKLAQGPDGRAALDNPESLEGSR